MGLGVEGLEERRELVLAMLADLISALPVGLRFIPRPEGLGVEEGFADLLKLGVGEVTLEVSKGLGCGLGVGAAAFFTSLWTAAGSADVPAPLRNLSAFSNSFASVSL